jgi:preprotein translocase subunit SecF
LEKTINFLKYRFVAIGLSIGLFILFMAATYLQGGFNYGVDFSGGVKITAKFENGIDAAKIRAELSKNQLDASVQQIGKDEENQYVVATKIIAENESTDKTNDKLQNILKKAFSKTVIVSVDSVGPVMGSSLKKSAYYGFVAAFILMLIYLAFRFEFKYSVGAIVAIFHDCLLAFAFCGITQTPINMPVFSAILTLAGYSVNDTIVIFDRIRENMNVKSKMTFIEVINKAMTQMLGRTIITSVLTLFTVVAIYLFGGEVLESFGKVLIFGMIIGCYSTIYIASPIVVWWERLTSK